MLGSIYVGRGQMNEHPRRGARRYVLLALVAMAALIAVGAAFAHGKHARSPIPGPFDEVLLLIVAIPLVLFYREPLWDVWRRAG